MGTVFYIMGVMLDKRARSGKCTQSQNFNLLLIDAQFSSLLVRRLSTSKFCWRKLEDSVSYFTKV